MTAIVGIINRQGVAFAADSAATVTISDKQKISNHANKIFELSKYEPVGVALCGNMDYRKLPWEQIIKMYRVKLDNTSFSSLHEYIIDFFSFVKTLRFDSIDGGNVNLFINSLFDDIFSSAKSNAKKKNLEETDSNIANLMYQELNSIVDIYKEKEVCSDFQGYNIEMFETLFKEPINNRLNDWLTLDSLPNDFEDVFLKSLYYILRSIKHVYTSTTVLVFFGYGQNELTPSYYSYRISELFEGKIKFTPESNYVVDSKNNACIGPFAQTDVANTVIRGIDDDLRAEFYKRQSETLQMVKNCIVDKMAEANAPHDFIQLLENIDMMALSETFKKEMDQYIWDNYISKLINIVEFLSKEDLADMAESLVKMTSLKRRVTTDAESVGGPVDVAVVTKGDGFIWIKRKHYFPPELNPNYFQRTKLN